MTRLPLTRRVFCRLTGLVGVGALLGAAGCGGGGGEDQQAAAKAPAAADKDVDPCNDLSGLTASQKKLRDTFEYVPVAPDPAETCAVCEFYQQPEGGSPCGGCQLFQGPVEPAGHCNSFSPVASG